MATRAVAMTVTYVAWDTAANAYKTGDAANITMNWSKDGVAGALNTTTVTEISAANLPGHYKSILSATETDCNSGKMGGKSTTAGIVIIGPTFAFDYIPNAVVGAAGGIPTSDASGRVDVGKIIGQAPTLDGNNALNVSAKYWIGGLIPAPTVTGVPLVDLKYILGTVLTETAGQIAAAFKKFFNIAAPASTMDHLVLLDTVTTLTNATGDTAGTTTLLGRLTAGRATNLDNLDAAISTRLSAGAYTAPDSAATITAAIFANVTDGTLTFAECMRLQNSSMLAVLSGAVAGAVGTVTVKDAANSKTRFTWAYDANGNRTAFAIVNKTL